MYTLSEESVQRLAQVYNLLNNLEVKGSGNIDIMYNSMLLLQGILQTLQTQKEGVVINNTKEKEE